MGLMMMLAWIFLLGFALILLGELESIKNIIYIFGVISIIGIISFISELFSDSKRQERNEKYITSNAPKLTTSKREDESYSEYTERVKNYR